MKDRKFLFLNLNGGFMSIAQRVQEAGYEAFCWYSKESLKGKGNAGEGFIEKVDDPFDIINKFRNNKKQLIIVIDDNSWGDTMDYLRSEGWDVIGSSHFADQAEHEREFGSQLAEKIGLNIPPQWSFTDFKSGQDFLKQLGKKMPDASLVFKADGYDMAGSAKTYLARNIDEMGWFMDWVDKDQQVHEYKVEKFLLQLKIEGVEADFSGWFNGEDFIDYTALTFEQKKIQGLGSAVGCLGNIVGIESAKESKLFRDHLYKLVPYLQKKGEINQWAVNTIVSEKDHKPYFLEWTSRHGWDSFIGEMTLWQEAGLSPADFYIMLADKTPAPREVFKKLYSATVRMYSESTGTNGKDVNGKPIKWDNTHEKDFWWYSVKKREDGFCEITDNPVGCATRCAATIDRASEDVYKLLDAKNNLVTTPDLFYSPNIGEKAAESEKKVRSWGWF
jgi:phosphoribosylamine-glycine ligase